MTGVRALLADRTVVPIAQVRTAAELATITCGLAAAGLMCIEVVLRNDDAIGTLREFTFPSGFLVGVGTVLSADQVDAAVAAGADFLVSPGLHDEVVERAREVGVPLIPGVATATEIGRAVNWGFDVLKLFPVEPLGGVGAVRALSAPFPGVSFVPSGGVTEALASRYLAEPSVLAVGGSWMLPSESVQADDRDRLASLAAAALRAGGR